MTRGIVARAVVACLLCVAHAAVALPIVELKAVGSYADRHEITVTPGTTVQLVYSISEAADLASFQNDVTFTGDFSGLSATLAGTWWGGQDATALLFNYNPTIDYWRLISYVDKPHSPPPYSYSNPAESSLVVFELTANSGDIEIDLLSLAEAGTQPPEQLWVSADPDTGLDSPLVVDTASSLPAVTIHVGNVVYGASPTSITVEDGPGTLPEKFDVDVAIQNVQNLWVWDFDAYWSPGGPRVLAPGDVAQGGWWTQSYWPTVVTEDYVRVGGGPDDVALVPVMQSGSGTLVTLTMDYAGVAPGTHGLEFRVAELGTYAGTPPTGFLAVIPAQVVDLEIVVAPGVPPATPGWQTEPHATAVDAIAMAATPVTDDHSPAGDIRYQFEINGAPQGWQANTDFALPSLGTNTEYVCRVQARDGVGNETPWSPAVAVYTLAADPVAGTPPLDDIQATSIRANWLHNGNPPAATTYQVGVWPGATATGDPDSLHGADGDDTFIVCDGLSANTQYTLCVRARNGDGEPTGWVPLGTAYTLAAEPLPGVPPLDQHQTTSIRANWLHNGNPPATTTYQVGVWVGASATGDPDTLQGAPGSDIAKVCGGLSVNAQYTFSVRAVNGAGTETDWVPLGSDYTLADVPGPGTVSVVGSDRLDAAWTDGNNPAGTDCEAELWTGTGFTPPGDTLVQATTWRPGTAATFDSLTPNTLYSVRVRARSHNPALPASDWTVLCSGGAYTAAVVPGALTLDMRPMLNGRLNPFGPASRTLGILSLAPNGNPAATTFAVQIGSDPDAGWLRFGAAGQGEDPRHLYANGAVPEPHTAAQWQNTRVRGLTPGTAYEFRAVAFNGADDPTAIVDVGEYATNGDCDVNRSGVATALDYAYIRAAMIRGDDFTDNWPADPNDHDGIGSDDLNDTRDRVLNP